MRLAYKPLHVYLSLCCSLAVFSLPLLEAAKQRDIIIKESDSLNKLLDDEIDYERNPPKDNLEEKDGEQKVSYQTEKSSTTNVSQNSSVNAYSGNWICDMEKSESLDNHMIALGIPWAARVAIKRFVPKKKIFVEGITWTEDSSLHPGGMSSRSIMMLDGAETETIHIINKSIIKNVTRIEGDDTVISNLSYEPLGHTQYVYRKIESGGDVFHIINQLTLKDGTVHTANIYYNRE